MGPTVELIKNLMGVSLAILAILGLVLVTIYAFYALYMAAQYQTVRNSGLQRNNGYIAQREFIRLLDTASREMIIYDDGDLVPDSIYDNEKVIQAVHDKLKSHPDFVMRCLFNCDSELLKFRKEFGSRDSQVQVRIRSEARGPCCDRNLKLPHFKIIDGGSCAYLSWHEAGSEARLYQTIDCSNLFRLGKNRVVQNIVGNYIDQFDHEFESAEAVEQTTVSEPS